MKTVYTNKTQGLAQIMFKDGTSVFLRRGDSHTSDKEVRSITEGIVKRQIRPSKRRAADDSEQSE